MKHRGDHAVSLTPPLRDNRSVQASMKTARAQPNTRAWSGARHAGRTQTSSPGVGWPPAGGRLAFLPRERESLICCQRPWRQAWEIREEIRVWEAGGGAGVCIPPGTPARMFARWSDRLTGCSVPGTRRAGQGQGSPSKAHGSGSKETEGGPKAPWGSVWATEPQPGASESSQDAQELTSHGPGAVPPPKPPCQPQQSKKRDASAMIWLLNPG